MASLDRVRTVVTAASLGLAAPACPPRHPSRLVVVWDQPGDRITVTTVVEERLLDNMVRYSVIRSRAGHGDEVLFAGGTEDYEAPSISSLPDGTLVVQFLTYVCAAPSGQRLRCSDVADLSSFQYSPQNTCCAATSAGVEACACAVERPIPALRAAYRSVASDPANWDRARGSAVALAKLRDPEAAARIERLLDVCPDDLWLRAAAARLDSKADVGRLLEVVTSGSHDERLTVARACVPALREALARQLEHVHEPRWAEELRTAAAGCELSP